MCGSRPSRAYGAKTGVSVRHVPVWPKGSNVPNEHMRYVHDNPHAPQGDVRGSSIDARYAGVVFTGPMSRALREARNAPEHPIPFVAEARAAGVSLARYELLKFLRVL